MNWRAIDAARTGIDKPRLIVPTDRLREPVCIRFPPQLDAVRRPAICDGRRRRDLWSTSRGPRAVDQGPATADAIETCVATESRPSGNQTQSSTAADSGRSGHQLFATWLQLRPGPDRIGRNLTTASLASQRDDTPNECRRHSVSTPSRDACDGSLSAMSCVNSGARFGTVKTFKARSIHRCSSQCGPGCDRNVRGPRCTGPL